MPIPKALVNVLIAKVVKSVSNKNKARVDMEQDQYPVFPEDDGTDRPVNPYSPV